MFFRMI